MRGVYGRSKVGLAARSEVNAVAYMYMSVYARLDTVMLAYAGKYHLGACDFQWQLICGAGALDHLRAVVRGISRRLWYDHYLSLLAARLMLFSKFPV